MSESPGAGSTPAADVRGMAVEQAGVVSRRQLLCAGMSSSAIARRARTGGWRVLLPGVYHVDAAPPSPTARAWAAWLYADSARWGSTAHPVEATVAPGEGAGLGAAIGGDAALWLAGLLDDCPDVIEVAVPRDRHLARHPGVRVLRRRGLPVHPALRPPRLTIDEALLDVVHRTRRAEQVVGLVLAAGQRRLTTAARILDTAERRPRLRWRSLVRDLCEELQDGVHSALERRYLHHVERAHALPRAERNARESAPTSGSWFRDVRYREQRLVVELDGRAAHPVDGAFRDRRRDNHAARLGETTLRYGWREVVSDPCGIAVEVADVLALRGWAGRPRPCGRGCAVGGRVRGGSLPLTGNDPPRSRRAG